jgi:tungstate transport system substrate-binding protein
MSLRRPPSKLLALLLAPTLLAAGCGGGDAPRPVRLATTTSTEASGLLEHLLPPFERQTGITVKVIAVGTGQALALGESGDADLLLVHARAREDAFMAGGSGVERRDVMWNDFVILGPPADPAGVRGSKDAAAALSKISASGQTFVSRGDDSGTHIRERALWERTGGRPGWPGYLEAGQGMGACLTLADEKQAYLLSDRGTWLSRRKGLELEVLVEGDPVLQNPYGAILVSRARHPGVNEEGARRLLDYLTSTEGQAAIAAFQVDGEILFHPARAP